MAAGWLAGEVHARWLSLVCVPACLLKRCSPRNRNQQSPTPAGALPCPCPSPPHPAGIDSSRHNYLLLGLAIFQFPLNAWLARLPPVPPAAAKAAGAAAGAAAAAAGKAAAKAFFL